MRRTLILPAALALAMMMTTLGSGATISQNMGGLGTATEFFGESFTTPSGGPFTNIAFNFYSNVPPVTPAAGGTAFLLSQEYLGTPSALGSATPGFLAQSTGISGGVYLFNPSLALQSNTTYFLYENATITTSGGNTITGGNAYFAPTSGSNFGPSSPPLQAANFLLTGNPTAAVPEPPSLALAGVAALAGLGWRLWRRRGRLA